MAIDRVELIMQAVECNKVQAMIYEDEIKDIPDSRLMDFFKFRLQFLDRYVSKELAMKKAITAYKTILAKEAIKQGKYAFESLEAMIDFIRQAYKGQEFCYGVPPFYDVVRLAIDEDGDVINKFSVNGYGKDPKLSGEDTQAVFEWLFKHQYRIGEVKFISVENSARYQAKKQEIELREKGQDQIIDKISKDPDAPLPIDPKVGAMLAIRTAI